MTPKFTITIATLVLAIFAGSITAESQTDTDPARDFYRLTEATQAAFKSGDHEKAQSLSAALLVEAENWKQSWNYGNAIHVANLVLGRVALAKGEMDDARKFLLAAGKTPGSPQLKSFGPDMVFAIEMLRKGEKDTVLQYFDLCEKFWDKRHSKLDEWRSAVSNNEEPNFGPNLRYFF